MNRTPSASRRSTGAELAARILGHHVKTVLDVGARWGTQDAWYRLAPLAKVIGFEPDPQECARLNSQASQHERFVQVALGSATGRSTLHLTREPGCSSIYHPNMEVVHRYSGLDIMTPVRDLEIATVRLDEWARHDGQNEDVVFMKLDVQGYELDVLRGAGALLDHCLGVEVEVEFNELYEGQPLFADVDQFLRSKGLTLWRIDNLAHYAERPLKYFSREARAFYSAALQSRFKAGAGRLFWGDALYFRDYRSAAMAHGNLESALTLSALFDAAGDTDAHRACLEHLAAKFGGQMTSEQRNVVDRHLLALMQ